METTNKLRVYVAASSSPDQMARAHAVSERLREQGIELTSTWIERAEQDGGTNNPEWSRDQRGERGNDCLGGVEACDVLVVLMPPGDPSFGAGWECGYATARDKRVVASGDTHRSAFLGMEHVTEVATDEEAIESVLREAHSPQHPMAGVL